MPQVVDGEIQGRRVGILALAQAKSAINRFFAFGLDVVQSELNRLSNEYKADWARRPQDETMTSLGLRDTSWRQGAEELRITFELGQPQFIVLNVLEREHPKGSAIPADERPLLSDHNASLIQIFLKAFHLEGERIVLLYNPGIPFKSVIYHELLHSCGDTPSERGIVDGVIRHSWVCSGALARLEKEWETRKDFPKPQAPRTREGLRP